MKDRVKILWHYDENDTLTLKAGKILQSIVDVKFQFLVEDSVFN